MPRKSHINLDILKEGFEKFFKEHGHYPRAEEIDACDYLPSSRQIQRTFGGLVNLRKSLGHPIINFSVGDNRSKIATEINLRGYQSERSFENILCSYFGKHFVHVEKYFGDKKNRFDFYVFAQNIEFGIDVFYARDIKSFQRIINIKEKKYIGLPFKVYFINLNQLTYATSIELQKLVANKKVKLPENVVLITYDDFLIFMRGIKALKAV